MYEKSDVRFGGEGLKDEMERRRVLSSRKVYCELDIYI